MKYINNHHTYNTVNASKVIFRLNVVHFITGYENKLHLLEQLKMLCVNCVSYQVSKLMSE